MRDVNEVKKEFIEIYTKNIHREGSKELLEYLIKSDFFVAPASTQFHSAYEGGLAELSINVYNLTQQKTPGIPSEIIVNSFFHHFAFHK